MIYIATHKHCESPADSFSFQKIWLGRKDVPTGYISDEEGNIFFDMQQNFAEVSAIFHMASAKEDNFQGLFHYRRYFAFDSFILNKVLSENEFDAKIKDYHIPDYIKKKIEKEFIVRPKKVSYYHSIHNCLAKILSVDDLQIMYRIIKELYPDSVPIVEKYMFYNNKMSCCNMFISKPVFTKEYVKWVTPIFSKMIEEVYISKYPVPSRIFGFLSEALMDIFILIKDYKVYNVPLLIGRNDLKKEKLINHFLKNLRNELSHFINKPRTINYENYS